jgi:hypothetical protein
VAEKRVRPMIKLTRKTGLREACTDTFVAAHLVS